MCTGCNLPRVAGERQLISRVRCHLQSSTDHHRLGSRGLLLEMQRGLPCPFDHRALSSYRQRNEHCKKLHARPCLGRQTRAIGRIFLSAACRLLHTAAHMPFTNAGMSDESAVASVKPSLRFRHHACGRVSLRAGELNQPFVIVGRGFSCLVDGLGSFRGQHRDGRPRATVPLYRFLGDRRLGC